MHSSQAARTAPCRGVHWAISWRTGRRVAGHALPCRGRVVARTRALAHCVMTQSRVAGPFRSQYKICIATLAPTVRAVLRVLHRLSQPPAPYRGALLHRIATHARCITTQSRLPQPRYNFLYSDPLCGQASHTSAPLARVRHSPLCLGQHISWPSAGRIVAHARPCRGRVLAVSWPSGCA